MLRPSSVYPSLDVLPSSVHSASRSTEAHSTCTIQRNTYRCRHSPEDALPTFTRVLLVQRDQPPRKGLPLLLGRLEANHGATGRIDRRFNGFEGYSRGRGSGLRPGGGFCLVRPAKSVPQSLLVNRFAILNIEEVNTDIREPIDIPPPLLQTGKPCLGGQNGKRDYPDDSPPIPLTSAERLSSFLSRSVPLILVRCILSRCF